MKRLIFTTMNYHGTSCLVTALEEEGRLWEVHLEKPEDSCFLGSIHVGKVQKILPNIKAAFVEIENRTPCYLPLSTCTAAIYTNRKKNRELKVGDELLVQVTQEALKTKAPSVSANLSFAGNYLILTTGNSRLGVSEKLSREERMQKKAWMEEFLPPDRTYGVIVRTNARKAEKEELAAELSSLKMQMDETLKKGSYSPCYTRILAGASRISKRLKNVYWNEIEKIITDSPEIFQSVSTYIQKLHLSAPCPVDLYEDKLLPLYKLYRLEHHLDEALHEKVWLRSGGFLIIEQTEAFVSIDVNSGKQITGKAGDAFCRKINLEAAREIARQLRVRNLYGMILIDFINMKNEEDQAQLLHIMQQLVKEDRIKTVAVDVTALGIMELTRKKEEKSLKEQLKDL